LLSPHFIDLLRCEHSAHPSELYRTTAVNHPCLPSGLTSSTMRFGTVSMVNGNGQHSHTLNTLAVFPDLSSDKYLFLKVFSIVGWKMFRSAQGWPNARWPRAFSSHSSQSYWKLNE